jgi:hypothetical protein
MSTFQALTDAELDAMFEVELNIGSDIDRLKTAYRELRDQPVTRAATDKTCAAIALAQQIHRGTRGELGDTRADDSSTIAAFARAIVELATLAGVERSR